MDQQPIEHLIGGGLAIIVPVVVVLLIVMSQALRILREYERGVIFRLGKLQGAKGPALFFSFPSWTRWYAWIYAW